MQVTPIKWRSSGWRLCLYDSKNKSISWTEWKKVQGDSSSIASTWIIQSIIWALWFDVILWFLKTLICFFTPLSKHWSNSLESNSSSFMGSNSGFCTFGIFLQGVLSYVDSMCIISSDSFSLSVSISMSSINCSSSFEKWEASVKT